MKSLKPALIIYAVFVAFFIIGVLYVTSSKNFEVTHFPKVEQKIHADGRYTAGSEEYYEVNISPALAWKEGKGKGWRMIGIVVLAAVGVFMGFVATDKIRMKAYHWPIYLGLAIAAACIFAAYSSTYANNAVKLSKEQYEQVKDSREKLSELFTSKELIR